MLKKISYGVLAVILAACSSDDEILKGKRISIFAFESSNLQNMQRNIQVPAAQSKDNWTTFGGNAEHNLGNIEFASRPQKAFEISLDWFWQNNFYSAPLVKNGTVYLISDKSKVLALDLANGATVFENDLSQETDVHQGVSSIGINGEKSLVGITNQGVLFALDAYNGKILWQKNIQAFAKGEIKVENHQILFADINNQLQAFNADNGENIFVAKVGKPEEITLSKGSSPIIVGDKIVAGFASGELAVLDAKGNILDVDKANPSFISDDYLSQIDGIVGSPSYVEGKVFYGSYRGPISCLKINDKGKFETVWRSDIGTLNAPLIVGDVVYVVSKDAHLMALDARDGKLIWNSDLPLFEDVKVRETRINYFGPIMGGGVLILASSDGYNIHVNPKNGKVIMQAKLHDGVQVAPIIANHNLLLVTSNAHLIGYR